uniref:Uncharacterized protein n=1 Tax=Romanomermis culicivorax TaxID=13658 RepID=A0A915JZN0_ROMCU
MAKFCPILKQEVDDFKLLTINARSMKFGLYNKDKQGILMQQSALEESFIRSKVIEVSTGRLFMAHPVYISSIPVAKMKNTNKNYWAFKKQIKHLICSNVPKEVELKQKFFKHQSYFNIAQKITDLIMMFNTHAQRIDKNCNQNSSCKMVAIDESFNFRLIKSCVFAKSAEARHFGVSGFLITLNIFFLVLGFVVCFGATLAILFVTRVFVSLEIL